MRISDGDVFSSSVRGNVRKQNEDSCGVFDVPNGKLYVVCDGMGGHAGGATASKLGVDSIANYFQQAKYPDIKLALANALEYANLQIIDAANEMPSLKGMGTTACVLLIQGDEAWIAHCGDSRIYLYCAEQQWLHRITKDHSYVQGLVDQGIITDAEAESHPNKNRILKALGIKPDCKPTVCEQPILPANGDTFLICSDGLSGMVNDEQLQYVLQQDGTILNKGQMMIQLALQAGGLDNITTQLIKISDSPHVHSVFVSQNPKERLVAPTVQKTLSSGNKKPSTKGLSKIFYVNMIVFAIFVCGGVLWTMMRKPSDFYNPRGNEGNGASANEDRSSSSGEGDDKNDGSSGGKSQVKSSYSIEYWEVYPTVSKHFTKTSNYVDSIKVDKVCTDKKKNYKYKQTIKGEEQPEGYKQYISVLYAQTIDGIQTGTYIDQPQKTTTPSKHPIKVEKFNCGLEGNLKSSISVLEDIQWQYVYYENNSPKETSDYYSKQEIKKKAQEKLDQAPDSLLCKVEWYYYPNDSMQSINNKSKYDDYNKQKQAEEQQKQKEAEEKKKQEETEDKESTVTGDPSGQQIATQTRKNKKNK